MNQTVDPLPELHFFLQMKREQPPPTEKVNWLESTVKMQDADRVEMNEHPNANDAGEQELVNIRQAIYYKTTKN